MAHIYCSFCLLLIQRDRTTGEQLEDEVGVPRRCHCVRLRLCKGRCVEIPTELLLVVMQRDGLDLLDGPQTKAELLEYRAANRIREKLVVRESD